LSAWRSRLCSRSGCAYGVTTQIVLDDEWHAIHKLSSSYSNIFRSFGYADHSIPLTILYRRWPRR
jgi:hypothetical protein